VSLVRVIRQQDDRENTDECIDLRLAVEILDQGGTMSSHWRGRRSNRKEAKPNNSPMI
jgi:hypothetical protein